MQVYLPHSTVLSELPSQPALLLLLPPHSLPLLLWNPSFCLTLFPFLWLTLCHILYLIPFAAQPDVVHLQYWLEVPPVPHAAFGTIFCSEPFSPSPSPPALQLQSPPFFPAAPLLHNLPMRSHSVPLFLLPFVFAAGLHRYYPDNRSYTFLPHGFYTAHPTSAWWLPIKSFPLLRQLYIDKRILLLRNKDNRPTLLTTPIYQKTIPSESLSVSMYGS